MPTPPPAARMMMAPAPMRDVRLTGRRLVIPWVFTPDPLFSAADDQRLRADASAVLTADGGQRYASLDGWLQAPSGAKVQCRRTGLTVALDAGPDSGVALLPLVTSPARAELVYTAAGAERRRPLQAVIDSRLRTLKLNLPFPDTTEGRALYGEVAAAMSTPAPEAVVEVSYTHRYRVPPPPKRPHIPLGVLVQEEPRFRAVAAEQSTTARVNPAVAKAVAVNPAVFRAAQPIRRVPIERVPVERVPIERVSEPDTTSDTPPEPVTTTFDHVLRIGLFRRLDDVTVYPDLPRQQQNGWGQVPGREGKKALLFRDSPRADAFFYLPTVFKLGFYGDADSALPPMRAEQYLDDAGDYRVKVTLVAVPSIEEAEREELRAYLRDVVLQRMVPYVRLSPASGLKASFLSELGAGPASDAHGLPASLRFTAADAVPDTRLVLQLDMEATEYALFCELLRAGLRGQVQLEAEGVHQGVDVRLELSDVLTNALSVSTEGMEEGQTPKVSVGNLLDLPVALSSVRVGLVDTGEVAGMVFEAEELDLARDQRLDARGAVSLPLAPKSIESWDDTIVALGPVQVDGGSPDDWLDRVHRDPSLEPKAFHVKVQAVFPAAGADRVQLLRLRLLRTGEAAPRDEKQLVPGAGPLDLAVRMTLAELAGQGGEGAAFALEYDSLYTDGGASLPQRIPIDPGTKDLPLLALVETAGATYRVEHDGTQEELDRAAAADLVTRLRQDGKLWRVYALQPKPAEPTQPSEPGTTTPPPQPSTTPEVSLITDLLAGPFASGQLQRVFAVLRASGEGAATSTLLFDAQSHAAQSWKPAAGTVPPFEYKITYLYADGKFKQVEGHEEGLMLVLDPPAAE